MKTRDEIYNILVGIIEDDFEVEADAITMQAHLFDDLDLDSIDALDLVVKLREITGKKLDPEAFKKVRTVEDVVNEIEKLYS